jgi:P pilus assembly chaperone PapD
VQQEPASNYKLDNDKKYSTNISNSHLEIQHQKLNQNNQMNIPFSNANPPEKNLNYQRNP